MEQTVSKSEAKRIAVMSKIEPTDNPTKPMIMEILKTKGINRKQRRDWYKKHKNEGLKIVKERKL